MPAQQHIFLHEMRAPWCLAQHRGLLHSACSLARGQARSEAAELCVCAAQHQPWLWGSPSRSRAGCQRPAAAQQCHLLGPGNLRDEEQKPREQRTWAGGAVWVLGAPCGSCQPAGFGPHPAQDALQRRGIASSATSSTVRRGSFPGLVLKLSFRKQGCSLGPGCCSCRVLSARCLHQVSVPCGIKLHLCPG